MPWEPGITQYLAVRDSGALIQADIKSLANSPFPNFFIPGIILFVMNGLSSLVIGILVIRRHAKYPWLVMYQGLVLTIWIIVEMLMVRPFHILMVIYGSLGLILIMLGWVLLRKSQNRI